MKNTITKPVYLLSPPRSDWQLSGKANFRSRQATAPDAQHARAEWASLADAIVAAGGEVLVLPPHPTEPLTGMIYTAEAGEFFRRPDGRPGFLLPNMASAHRRAEAAWIEQVLSDWGFVVETVGENGRPRWEAQGDAIRAPTPQNTDSPRVVHTFGIGPDARSEAGAYPLVREQIGGASIHLEFRADPWFHGNTFLNFYAANPESYAANSEFYAANFALDERNTTKNSQKLLMMVCPDALSASEYARLRAFFPDARIHEISREESLGYDTNALQVQNTVIAPMTVSPGSDAALRAIGLDIVRLDLSELFLKGGGAPVCLSNRLWGLKPSEIPPSARWRGQLDDA